MLFRSACLLHAKTGEPVSDDAPALPGETLIIEGEGLVEGLTVLVADAAVAVVFMDGEHVSFDLPGDVSGSFVEVSLQSEEGRSNVATTTISGPADPVQLSSVEVDGLVKSAAGAVDAPGLVVAVVDRAGNPLAIYRRAAATADAVETALSLARTGADRKSVV